MRFRGPLADSYFGAALLVIFALVPYLALTSAIPSMEKELTSSIGLSSQALQTTTGMANAGYAFGTVLSVQLAVRMAQRRLLLTYAILLVIGSLMAVLATVPALFIAGHILQGLCTSLMLITAVPPLVTGWPAKRMPITAGIMDLCIFGAVALGPILGGFEAGAASWRLLFWLAAVSSVLALVFVLLTWQDTPPPEHKHRWDPVSMVLAGGGTAAAFFGASELTTHAMVSVIVLLPLLSGTIAIVLLVIHQATVRNPLMPVREMLSTKPVAGTIAAMAAGAASIPAIELVGQALEGHGSPDHIGSLFWPFFGSAVVVAVLFGLVIRTRLLAPFVLTGLVLLASGIVVLTGVTSGPHYLVTFGSGLVGAGVGASVAPALFVAGYSLRAMNIQRVFALLELLRAVAAFMVGPILLHLALTTNGGVTGSGIKTGLWVCFAIAASGALIALYLFVIGRAVPQKPDIETWEKGEEPAWNSPPLADGIRHGGGYRERLAELVD
jgi:MFS family permease